MKWLLDFTRNVYIPDVLALAGLYEDYYEIGQGSKKLLAYGVFDLEDTLGGDQLLGGGISEVGEFSADNITESVEYSWYNDTDPLNPSNGKTEPVDPHGKDTAYSWLKAPRYKGDPFEVGPLARMWVNGDYQTGVSVMDRHAARAFETRKIGEAMEGWLDELTPGANVYDGYSLPKNATGIGLTEAPRGALGHWVGIAR